MSEEILINVTPTESRVAVVENGMLQEVWLERASHVGYVGNIYRGRVSRVLPPSGRRTSTSWTITRWGEVKGS